MPFKVKDLLVDVSSATVALQCQPTFLCHFGCSYYLAHSACHFGCSQIAFSVCHYGCTFQLPSICTFASVTVTCFQSVVPTTDPISPILQASPQLSGPVLGNLKQQLREALTAVEKQEAAEAESLQPQTLADVEMLEKKFSEAQEELRARKAELQKKQK
jgi:hypothetical protein